MNRTGEWWFAYWMLKTLCRVECWGIQFRYSASRKLILLIFWSFHQRPITRAVQGGSQQHNWNCVESTLLIFSFNFKNYNIKVTFNNIYIHKYLTFWWGDGLVFSAAKLKFQDSPNCCLQLGIANFLFRKPQIKLTLMFLCYFMSLLIIESGQKGQANKYLTWNWS